MVEGRRIVIRGEQVDAPDHGHEGPDHGFCAVALTELHKAGGLQGQGGNLNGFPANTCYRHPVNEFPAKIDEPFARGGPLGEGGNVGESPDGSAESDGGTVPGYPPVRGITTGIVQLARRGMSTV